MPRMQRWRINTLMMAALIGTAASPLHGRDDETMFDVILLKAPPQLVEIADERGRDRLWHFEASVVSEVESGRIRGGMVLERANVRLEFRPVQVEAFVEDGQVRRAEMTGRGLKTTGNRDEDFAFTATIELVPQGEHFYVRIHQQDGDYAFEADGTLTVSS